MYDGRSAAPGRFKYFRWDVMPHEPEPSLPSISIVTPTFREALNLPEFVERIGQVRANRGLDLELIIVDDNSRDGTEELVASLKHNWVRLIVRRNERGLSSAVIRGLEEAKNNVVVVMDADLSHPPETIPALVERVENGADFVIGSRYVAGGSTDAAWGVFRWLNSKVATLMARPFTSARDPMAGFFAMRRERFKRAERLNPIGYKIGLELIVKCRCRQVEEVPIHFADRTRGESKLNFREQLRYVKHLSRLFKFRYSALLHLSLLTLVVAAYFIPVSVFLPQQSYFVDETTQLSGLTLSPIAVTKWLAGEDPHRFGVPPDRSPPMSYWIGWLWSQVFGLSETTMRWFGVFCAGLAVIAVFEAARRAWGFGAALVSGLLTALSPNTIVFAAEIRPYPVFLMFAAGAMYCLTGLLAHPSRTEWKWLIAMSACCLLAIYTHFFGVLMTGAVFSAALITSIVNRNRIYPVVATGAATTVIAGGLWPFIAAAARKSGAVESTAIDATELMRFAYRGLFGHPVMTTSVLAQVAGTVALGGLCICALWPKIRATAASYAVLTAIVAGSIAAVIAGLIIESFQGLHPSYNLWRLPAIAMLCGSAVAVRSRHLRPASWYCSFVLIVCSGFGALQLMRHGHAYSNGPHREIDSIIERLEPGNVSVIHEDDATWGKIYFPLVFTFGGALPQYLAPTSGSSLQLTQLPNLEGEQRIDSIATRYIVLIDAHEQSHIDLARHLEGKAGPGQTWPLEAALLNQPNDWREVERHRFVTMLDAQVVVFERVPHDARPISVSPAPG